MAKTESAGGKGKTFVKYVALPGIVSERSVLRKDWEAIGIDHDSVTFNAGNRFMVDASDLSDEALDYFKSDADFSVSTKDSPPALAGDTGTATVETPTA